MKKLYNEDGKNFINYHKQVSLKNKAPCVIFLHGFMSDMNGHKAISVENYCKKMRYNFIRFDNFGHGASSGKFVDQTISDWLRGLKLIIHELTNTPILLVGSSMGAWIAMLYAKLHAEKIMGVVTLAAALDFTEELLWNKFTEKEKNIIKEDGFYNVGGNSPDCGQIYPISYKLIIDGRRYLLLDKNIEISCPVCLIHGMEDKDVTYNISMRAAEKLNSKQVTIKLIKDANHMLSRPSDLDILHNSIEEIMNIKNY